MGWKLGLLSVLCVHVWGSISIITRLAFIFPRVGVLYFFSALSIQKLVACAFGEGAVQRKVGLQMLFSPVCNCFDLLVHCKGDCTEQRDED